MKGGIMKHKILWTLIGIMAVAALVLASCAGDGGNGGNGGNGEDEPQYGGKMTFRTLGYLMKEFDPLLWDNNMLLQQIFDQYYSVPWEKGPAGTGEYGNYRASWYPLELYEPDLLESFEVVSLYQVNYKLREGIHYWDKAPVNGRELTVDDIMWNWLRSVFHERAGTYLRADPAASATFWEDYLQEIEDGVQPEEPLLTHLDGLREVTPELEEYYPDLEGHMRDIFSSSYSLVSNAGYDTDDLALLSGYLRKIDDYNFEMHSARCSRTNWSYINGIWPTPREVTEDDEFNDWDTVVGTGPWIPTSYNSATEVTFERNPDYWKHDPLHPENQLPYADEMQILVIEDETTFYAALETAQLDSGGVEWYKVDYFQDNYPEMVYYPGVNGWSHCIFVRNDIPPFNDVRVRQACMLAIDHQAILDHYQGFAQLLCWPEQEWATPVYTPFNQLPAETQALFGYDPDAARALLDEAGYPNGFDTELTVYPSSEDRESGLIVQDYLADVGIDIEVQTPDAGTYGGVLYGRRYEHMISCWWSDDFPGDAMYWAEGGALNSPYNFGNVDDPIAYEVGLAVACMEDDDDYYGAIKADNVRRLGMMYQILVPTPVGGGFQWPWMKGGYGATDLGWPNDTYAAEVSKYIWIDQDLKDSMGY